MSPLWGWAGLTLAIAFKRQFRSIKADRTQVEGSVKPLRLGVLLGCATLPPHLGKFLESLNKAREVELVLLVTREPAIDPAGTLATMILSAERAALDLLGRLFPAVSRRARKSCALSRDIRAQFERSQRLPLRRDETDAHRLDLLLVFGTGLEPDALQLAPAEKIIQVELGTVDARALHLAGFAEAHAAADETPVAVYRDGNQLARGGNRTKPTFHLNQAALWDRAASLLVGHLKYGLELPGSPGRLQGPSDKESRPASKSVSTWSVAVFAQLLTYPLYLAGRLARLAMRQLRGQRQWSVALHRRSASMLEWGEPMPMEAPPAGTYWADPILYRCPASKQTYCFVEEFDHSLGRAHIAALQLAGGQWRRCGTALREAHHLSFPFLFEYQGGLYMCPEGGAAGNIVVYRCVDLPLRWEACNPPLMTDVSATDTMLFEHDGRWWMLTNLDYGTPPDHQSELHLFHADSPLSTDWKPVPGNPVKLSSRGARNGGLMKSGNRIFRFGQVHGFYAYGQSLNMYEIVRLDPTGYEEVLVEQLQPPAASKALGMHSYSSLEDCVAIDLLGALQPKPR